MARKANSPCQHDRVELRLTCPDCGEAFDRRLISRAELDARAIDLPDRQAMSLLGSGLLGGGLGSLPINPATPTDPANPVGPPAQEAGTPAIDPMGVMSKFAPDPSSGGPQPYAPETSSSSQT